MLNGLNFYRQQAVESLKETFPSFHIDEILKEMDQRISDYITPLQKQRDSYLEACNRAFEKEKDAKQRVHEVELNHGITAIKRVRYSQTDCAIIARQITTARKQLKNLSTRKRKLIQVFQDIPIHSVSSGNKGLLGTHHSVSSGNEGVLGTNEGLLGTNEDVSSTHHTVLPYLINSGNISYDNLSIDEQCPIEIDIKKARTISLISEISTVATITD